MEEGQPKKPVWQKWWFWAIIAVFLLALVGSQVEEDTTTNAPVKKTSFNWANADLTEQNIKTALAQEGAGVKPILTDSDFPKDITKVQVEDNSIYIYYKVKTFWDETDLVKRAGATAIYSGSILYSNPAVKDVTLVTQTEMQDQYGKISVDAVINISFNKGISDKADWKGLADRHITDPGNIYRISPIHFINPGIMKNVKTDEIEL